MLILASKSPRRNDILKEIYPDFKIVPSDVDESDVNVDPSYTSLLLAMAKANDVYKDHLDDIVIGSDTIVLYKNKIFGKPKDENEAREMLKTLSNKKHYVITGYSIISKEFEFHGRVKSSVYFNKLDDDLINRYIASGSPFDKAGGYGIQDKEFNLVKKIRGSYTNVMGFPKERIEKIINKIKREYKDLL